MFSHCFLATIAKNGPISVSFFHTKGELNHRLSQTLPHYLSLFIIIYHADSMNEPVGVQAESLSSYRIIIMIKVQRNSTQK